MPAKTDLNEYKIVISKASSTVWLFKKTETKERSFTSPQQALEIIEAWMKKEAIIHSDSEKIYQSFKRSARRRERWLFFKASLKRGLEGLKIWISRLASKH